LRRKAIILGIVLLFLVGMYCCARKTDNSNLSVLPNNELTVSADEQKIALIYKDNLTWAESFETLLESNSSLNFSVTLIKMSIITSGMFSDFDLIIIGTDTGDIENWGNSSLVAAIDNSQKPIIGIGKGGYSFFGKLFLKIGWPNGAISPYDEILVMDSSHRVFKLPNLIPSGNITVVSIKYDARVIYLPSIPAGLSVLGCIPDDSDYYPFVLEENKYLLWGFTNPADLLTVTGQDLFTNAVYYMLNFSGGSSIPGFEIIWVAITFVALIFIFQKRNLIYRN
jgi:hypothetical protein